MQTVVAGLIRQGEQILIAQRGAAGAHPLKWEFPGGKLEPGESAKDALVRELREELGIEARLGAEYRRYEFAYAGKKAILLVFFEVESYSGEMRNAGMFADLVWEHAKNLTRYDFLEGDLMLVQLLGEVEINQV